MLRTKHFFLASWFCLLATAQPIEAGGHLGCLSASERTALENLHAHSARSIADVDLSGDGSALAVGVDDSIWSEIDVFDGFRGKLLWQKPTGSPPKEIAISTDKRVVAAAFRTTLCHAPHVERWSTRDGSALPPLEDQAELSSLRQDAAQSLAFTSDGSALAAATSNAVRVWSLPFR